MVLKLTIVQDGKNNQVHEFSSMEELSVFAGGKVKKVAPKAAPKKVAPKKKSK